MKKILIIDFSVILKQTFHSAQKDATNQDEMVSYWRHLLLSSVLNKKNIIKPDEIILVLDHHSWRKDFFKFYKAKRELKRNEDLVGHQFFIDTSNQFIEEIKENFPWVIIKEYGCEGDDVIFVLAKELSKENKVVIGSIDKDLLQLLLLNDNIEYFSFMDDSYKTIEKSYEFILRHIIHGDSGDGIPNILTQDNCFVSGIRQKGCGDKKINEILSFGLEEYIEKHKLKDNWIRNKTLIELKENEYNEKYYKNVLTQYQNYTKNKYDFLKILSYFRKHKLKKLQENINEFN